MELEKFAKVLAMTTSDNDAEALAAIRTANKILKESGITWADLLAVPKQEVKIFIDMTPKKSGFETDDVPYHLRNPVVIDAMFRAVYAVQRDHSDFWVWLDSVKHQWDQHGSLTQGQYDGLRRSYARVMRGRT